MTPMKWIVYAQYSDRSGDPTLEPIFLACFDTEEEAQALKEMIDRAQPCLKLYVQNVLCYPLLSTKRIVDGAT